MSDTYSGAPSELNLVNPEPLVNVTITTHDHKTGTPVTLGTLRAYPFRTPTTPQTMGRCHALAVYDGNTDQVYTTVQADRPGGQSSVSTAIINDGKAELDDLTFKVKRTIRGSMEVNVNTSSDSGTRDSSAALRTPSSAGNFWRNFRERYRSCGDDKDIQGR